MSAEHAGGDTRIDIDGTSAAYSSQSARVRLIAWLLSPQQHSLINAYMYTASFRRRNIIRFRR
jgi:hypothetical protein